MYPVRQEDGLGCAVACVAFVLNIKYAEAVSLFNDGQRRVREKANFYCPEIVEVLAGFGLQYRWKKLEREIILQQLKSYTIIFVKRSKRLPSGHFLCWYMGEWMDPWLNMPSTPIEAGFRTFLPGKADYIICPTY